MKQIGIKQVWNLFEVYNLVPSEESWIVNQDSGGCERIDTNQLVERMEEIPNPVFKTDDDGRLMVVTLDIYYNFQKDDLYTGNIIRMLLYRRGLQKRIQPVSESNCVGAHTSERLYS